MPRFSDTLLEHARYPHNLARGDHFGRVGRADLDGRPPYVEIFLEVQCGQIVRASFDARGCGVTVAACSALTEIVKLQSTTNAAEIDAKVLDRALDGVPSDKYYCLQVAVSALRAALNSTEGR